MLQSLFNGDCFHRTHFLAAKTGDTSFFSKAGFLLFDGNDAGRAAFRTLTAANTKLPVKLRVRFHELFGNGQKESRDFCGKVKLFCIRHLKWRQVFNSFLPLIL